ncbi:LmbU family transcriptional regulator [Actinoplanes sp. NEAU-A12]|uniref:LmbU family transcriptional regulator n=1 Tax=Actinoplanes sandaracinus TaxID=3045177 RepID=A0ABT6WHS2_9ACTN|nr:LmbU family transcriptional regulator [Actinoplanes sandaracinus]MDI6099285.1 LmbU family transcriptional regulator [Actinoplanes sandaracinus]
MLTTKVALQLPADAAFEEWENAGHMLAGVLSSSSWWLGDWLIYGREHFSDRYERAVHAAGLSYQTLRNYAWVAGRYPAGRRRPALSFQHHAALASLNVGEQEQWLQRAQEKQWTLRQLRSALLAPSKQQGAPGGEPNDLHRLAVPRVRLHRWREAAEQSGVDVEQWITLTLDRAAEQVLTR